MMSFGYSDGTVIEDVACEVSCITNGDSCYQLITFKEDGYNNHFILDFTQKSRDILFNHVKERYGNAM